MGASPDINMTKRRTQTQEWDIPQEKESQVETQVSNDHADMRSYLTAKVQEFEGGSLYHHRKQWEELTSDKEVLQSISRLCIEVQELLTQQKSSFPHNHKTEKFVGEEIKKLLKKKVIERTSHEEGEFISPTFVTEKSDGGYKFILNLKRLNKIKFKMQTLKSILCLVRPDAYMCRLDIKDAYYSIPIHIGMICVIIYNFLLFCFFIYPAVKFLPWLSLTLTLKPNNINHKLPGKSCREYRHIVFKFLVILIINALSIDSLETPFVNDRNLNVFL